ncbi:hypothetical protein ACVRXF_00295 [Streptococcus orisasini]
MTKIKKNWEWNQNQDLTKIDLVVLLSFFFFLQKGKRLQKYIEKTAFFW